MPLHPDEEARQAQRKDELIKPKGLKPCKSFEQNGEYCTDCAEQRGITINPENFDKFFVNYQHMGTC